MNSIESHFNHFVFWLIFFVIIYNLPVIFGFVSVLHSIFPLIFKIGGFLLGCLFIAWYIKTTNELGLRDEMIRRRDSKKLI